MSLLGAHKACTDSGIHALDVLTLGGETPFRSVEPSVCPALWGFVLCRGFAFAAMAPKKARPLLKPMGEPSVGQLCNAVHACADLVKAKAEAKKSQPKAKARAAK